MQSKELFYCSDYCGKIEKIIFIGYNDYHVIYFKDSKTNCLFNAAGHFKGMCLFQGDFVYLKGHWGINQKYGETFYVYHLKIADYLTEDWLNILVDSAESENMISKKLSIQLLNSVHRHPDHLLRYDVLGMRSLQLTDQDQQAGRTFINYCNTRLIMHTLKQIIEFESFIPKKRLKWMRISQDYATTIIQAMQIHSETAYALWSAIHPNNGFMSQLLVNHLLNKLLLKNEYAISISKLQWYMSRELPNFCWPQVEQCLPLLGWQPLAVTPTESVLINSAFLKMEQKVAEKIAQLHQGQVNWNPHTMLSTLSGITQRLDFRLSESQDRAIRAALTHKVTLITGGPGTGKSTIIQVIAQTVKQQGARCVLCAPTGRAAKRMEQTTGIPASTIHRLLGVNYESISTKPTDLCGVDWVIIDEASMVSLKLLHLLLNALPQSAALLLIGDPDQLPSVEHGNVLEDLIRANLITQVHLNEVFRQDALSPIRVAADAIKRNTYPVSQGIRGGFDCIRGRVLDVLVRVLTVELPCLNYQLISDVQVLTPENTPSIDFPEDYKELNHFLRQIMNWRNQEAGVKFWINDKVMQTVNNYDLKVFNGDVGIVTERFPSGDIRVRFDENTWVRYPLEAQSELVLAYSITIHKSQGSEYPVVIIPLSRVVDKKLLYTAITRAKDIVIVIDDTKSPMMFSNYPSTYRTTTLTHQLISNFSPMGNFTVFK